MSRSLRRSNASASDPPMSEQMISGASCPRLSSPTCSDEPVRRKTCRLDATIVSCRPKNDTSCPAYSRRYCRDSRSGDTSTRTRRRPFSTDTLPVCSVLSSRFAKSAPSERRIQSAGQGLLDGLDELGRLGVDHRAEADRLTARRDEELLEVPADVSRVPVGRVRRVDELLVERVATVAVHLDLLGHREGDAVRRRAERLDLVRGAGLLLAELVAGDAEHAEPAVLVLLVDLLEARVLRREPALRGDVHEEDGLVLVVVEVDGAPVQRVDGGVVDGHGRQPTPSSSRNHMPAAPLHALGAQALRLLSLVPGDEPTRRGDDPPPRVLAAVVGEEPPDGARRSWVSGLPGDLAVAHDVTRLEPVEHRDDRSLEVRHVREHRG